MGMNENEGSTQSSAVRQPAKNVVIDAPADPVSSVDIQGSSPSRKIRKEFQKSQHHFSPRDQRRKLYGVRQLRRCENLNFLLRQGEKDEDESGEVDFVDLVSHHNSAFQELFMEQDKMSTWMSFVDSSEEEQQRVLATANNAKLRDIFHYIDDNNDQDENDDAMTTEDVDDGFEHVGSTAGLTLTPSGDAASGGHTRRLFAATANECFRRINRNLRGFLRRNRFPTGELRNLEEELVAFFVEWPSSVFVASLPDGYRRLMLHAVSQYLDLDARSFDVSGSRQTQVENHQSGRHGNIFVPPPTPLATFITENKAASLLTVQA